MAVKIIDDFWLGNYIDQEIATLKKLRKHPHIVEYIGTDRIENHGKVIIMELCSMSLNSQIERDGSRLDDVMIVNLVGGLSEAIKFLVKKKLVHRDIKPDNILFLNGCYKLADFGMAVEVNNFEDRLHFPNGTREYAHPSIFKCMVAWWQTKLKSCG